MPIPAGGLLYAGRDEPTYEIEVEASFGANLTADPGSWLWTDLSSRLRNAPITTRVPGPGSPGTCAVTLDNDDGALSPLNPMSPYWPNVESGTPLRVRLRHAEDAFDRTSSSTWSKSESGQVWSAAGGTPPDYSVSGGAGRHAHTTVHALRRTVLETTLLDCEQTFDVAPSVMLTGAALVTGAMARMSGDQQSYYWLRAEFNAGGSTLQLKISKTVAGVETQLASLTPVPGVAYAANTALRVVASVVGSRLAIKVWNPAGAEPAGWHLSVTDTSITTAGRPGLQSWLVLGNTNALPVSAIFYAYSLRVDRFTGNADQWQPTYLPIRPGESSSAVRVTASALLRRLGQGTSPLRSALSRKAVAANPVAYWPMEGGPDLVAAESALAGGPALRTTSTVAPLFGQVEGPAGSDSLPDLSSHGVLVGSVPPYTHAGQWQVEFWFRTDTGNSLDFTASVPLQWDTPDSSVVAWDALLFIGQGQGNPGLGNINLDISGYNPPTGTPPSESFRLPPAESIIVSGIPNVQGTWRHLRVAASQVGANIQYTAYLDGVALGTATTASTLAPVTAVTVNPLQGAGAYAGVSGLGLSSVGHAAVHKTITDPGTFEAGLGHVGEAATTRIGRLCAEQGVPVEVVGVDSEPMGPQRQQTLLELLSECVLADGGILSERQFGLLYSARNTRYNQPVDMTIDLAAYKVSGRDGDVLSPTYDDHDKRNDWTVSRPGGGEARVVDEIQVSRQGRYDDSVALNVASDQRLSEQASWRVHLGTFEYLREQTFPIDLAANPGLLDGWLSCGLGSRILRTSPPSQYGPEPLDRLVEGWTETIGPRSWLVQVTPSAAQPWDVATVDGPQRVAADGTVTVGLLAGAMSLLLSSTPENGTWTEDPADFPLPMRVGGEQVTATGIARSFVDAFGRTVAAGGWGPPWEVNAGAATAFSVAGSEGVIAASGVNVEHHVTYDVGARTQDVRLWYTLPVTPTGAPINVGILLRYVDANNYVWADSQLNTDSSITLRLIKRVGGVPTQLGTASSPVAHSTSVPRAIRAEVNGSLLRVRLWSTSDSEPLGWDLSVVDPALPNGSRAGAVARLMTGNTNPQPVSVRIDNVATAQPQTVTLSARGVNGVTRSWPAGTEVDVWNPAIVAL